MTVMSGTNASRKPPERAFLALGAGVIVLQRIALPIGDQQLPLVPLVVALAMVWWLAVGAIHLSPGMAVGYLIFASYAFVLVILKDGSVLSVAQVLLVWAPLIFDTARGTGRLVVKGGLYGTLAAAFIAILQACANAFHLTLVDPFSYLPSSIVLKGYATTYELVRGGGWYKANGFVFLEPSFLSLLAALGLLCLLTNAVEISHKWAAALVLIGGALSSIAVSGLVILPALTVALVANRRAISNLLVTAGTLVLVVSLPASQPFLQRAANWQGTSNDARLTRPYSVLLDGSVLRDPYFGMGPGAARSFVESINVDWTVEVTTPTMAKLAFEYGALGLLFLTGAVVYVWARSDLPGCLKLGLLTAVTIPTDALTSGLLGPYVLLAMAGRLAVGSEAGAARAKPLSRRPRRAYPSGLAPAAANIQIADRRAGQFSQCGRI